MQEYREPRGLTLLLTTVDLLTTAEHGPFDCVWRIPAGHNGRCAWPDAVWSIWSLCDRSGTVMPSTEEQDDKEIGNTPNGNTVSLEIDSRVEGPGHHVFVYDKDGKMCRVKS
jgi:hypothetical protein